MKKTQVDLDNGPLTHPTDELLATYSRGELAGDAQDKVQHHLVLCRRCSELVLELREIFTNEGPSAPQLAPIKDAWHEHLRLRDELSETNAAQNPGPPCLESKPPPFFQRLSFAYALVFCLLLFIVVQMFRDVSSVHLNPSIIPLYPLNSQSTRSREEQAVFEMDSYMVFQCISRDYRQFSDYRLVMADTSGKELYSIRGLNRQPGGSFSLLLFTGHMDPGPYRLSVFGVDGSTNHLLEEYTITLIAAR